MTYNYPWKLAAYKDKCGNIKFYSVLSQKMETICEIFITNNPENELKNACLIACAPEMLEILELIEAWLIATNQTNEMLDIVTYTVLKSKGKIGLDSSKDNMI